MPADARPLVPEELLAHSNFVRALARRLLDHFSDVDDVTQDAWLAALRAPPRERVSVRTWLGRVVQRFVFERRRTSESRERRERLAAPSEALVSTHELAAKNEVLRFVADAVVALDEEHRAVILLRFYDGSPTAEVARRLGEPLETVRSRLKRAIVLLREELDRRAKGGREEWMGALAMAFPLTSESAVTVVSTSIVAKLFLSVAIAATLIGGIWIWTADGGKQRFPLGASDTGDAATRGVKDVAAAAPTNAPAEPTRAPEPLPTGTSVAAIAPKEGAATTNSNRVGTVSVTVVDANDHVVPGKAKLTVREVGSNDTSRTASAILDQNHADISFDRAPVGNVDVEVELENRPAGTLHQTAVVRETQTTSLKLRYDGPDPATSICVRLKGLDYEETLAVFADDEDPKDKKPAIDPPPIAKLIAADRSTIASVLVVEMKPRFLPLLVFAPVGTGPYTLQIDDPRWRPVRIDSLHASDAIAIELVGNVSLTLVVRKRAGEKPLANVKFEVKIIHDTIDGAHDEISGDIEGFARRSEVNGDGSITFEGLAPTSFTVLARAEGIAFQGVPIADLKPGEHRVVEILAETETGAGVIEGVLLASDRTPIAKGTVSLYAPAEVGESPESIYFPIFIPTLWGESMSGGDPRNCRLGRGRATTDEAGRFRFTGLPLGRWILGATNSASLATIVDDVVLDAQNPKRDDVEIVEADGGTVVGHLVTNSSANFSGLTISVQISPKQQSCMNLRSAIASSKVPVAADGTFRIGPFPPGPTALRLLDNGAGSIVGWKSAGLALTTVDVPPSGETTVDIPADAFVPGEIHLTIVVDDQPQAEMIATAVRHRGKNDPFEMPFSEHGGFRPRGRSDEKGHAKLARLLPGTLHIAVASVASGWSVDDVATVVLPAAGVVDEVISIHTSEGTVTLLDSAGQPLRERSLVVGTPIQEKLDDGAEPEVSFESDDAAGPGDGVAANDSTFTINEQDLVPIWASVRTDADGKLTLRWPVGRIGFAFSKDDSPKGRGVFFDWTARGPETAEVRLR